MSAAPPLLGGCLCGQVRYRATARPLDPHICHCAMCQRAGGAPMVAWIGFPPDQFTVTAGAVTFHESSPGIRRGFCRNGGSALAFQRDGRPRIGITIASLDDPAQVAPTIHVYDATRWVSVSDGLPRYPDKRPS